MSSLIAPLVRNAWYVAAWSEEVHGQPLARTIMDEPLVLFRDADGRVGALEDRCCHRAAPLSHGTVAADGLQCGYHGLTFDRDGRCVVLPGQAHIPSTACVRAYPLVERQDFVWIWMGDPAKADPALIIDHPCHDDPRRWPNKKGVTEVAGNYMLLIDNLMDLTHIGFLHQSTIGVRPQAHVEAKIDVGLTERGVRFQRWMANAPPHAALKRALGDVGNVDRWADFEFVAPAFVLQWSGGIPAGQCAFENRDQPGYHVRLFHGMTPISTNRTLYFWSGANGYRQDDPSATEEFYQELVQTFAEDKAMIEAQQKRIELAPERGPVTIGADRVVSQARLALDRMIAAQGCA